MTNKEVRENDLSEEERAIETQSEASTGENWSPVDELQTPSEAQYADEVQTGDDKTAQPSSNRNLMMWGVVAALAVASAFGLFLFLRSSKTERQLDIEVAPAANSNNANDTAAPREKSVETGEIALPPDVLARAGIEYTRVTQRPAVALLNVTGAVEANPQQTLAVTLLVGGRVERVNVAVGDRVGAGAVLAVIASPQIVELRGNLRTARTRLDLAERNLARVKRAENRVAVLQAKAKLDEAQATLDRTRRLIELGAGAGKDLIAAEAAYKSAKADFDFQSNIALSREVQEAQSAVETARTEVAQIRSSLSALGASGDGRGTGGSTALITVRAPASGIVTERFVNDGAGVDAGKPLFTITNLSTVWVIANVPEANIGQVRQGTYAEIRATALGSGKLIGRVSYIDPQLNEATRTARVRVEMQNPGERLRPGMFVEVGLQAGTSAASGEELVVPTEAIQRIGDRTFVFIPQEKEPGRFETRDVQIGAETNGYTRVLSGLELGEPVVTKGSFALKSQLMKGLIGDDDK